MSQIVVRLLVASDLWEILCPRIESNVGFAENGKRFFLFLQFHFIPFISEGMPVTNSC